MDIENQEINQGHYTELLDRLFVCSSMLDQHCLNHPLTKKELAIKEKIESALAELAEAYQQVGQLTLQKTK